ncbi:SDR family NAD(P)-dependent oxidoreductase [Quadrisphaera sp. DSM 44207]|uniref:SDR family NAD(P)-dependent oxidoreductase n=1 Tax=Quadrisphaera sp. DSM 44207 TaxID=1881057 RepID=UPI000888983A|nr:glucose 1-dehydrogenase [Quadrisphaera sp. DSM 44207]SDQ11290.1 NAD(P)-dependent dehydrogenase, short-chain alcohol dehydrogenase family [Quadrisphaera sp. DSM 44207]
MTVLDTFRLDGRRALVTGGNRGLGLAFARALAEAGADVVLSGRDGAANDAAVERLAGEGLRVRSVAADLTGDDGPRRTVDGAVEALGGLDVLVNNAGTCFHRPAAEVPDEEWDAVFDLNVRALWKTTQAAFPHLREGGGSVVNVGSMSGFVVNRPQWQPAYNASKAAVHHLTRSLAAEWAPLGIRVNAVAPGYVRTEMAPVDEPRFRRHWIEDAPVQRAAAPEEIAPTVLYLASDASAFATGSVVVVDGGYSVF